MRTFRKWSMIKLLSKFFWKSDTSSQCKSYYRHYLRLSNWRNWKPFDSKSSVFRQVGWWVGKRQKDGKNSSRIVKTLFILKNEFLHHNTSKIESIFRWWTRKLSISLQKRKFPRSMESSWTRAYSWTKISFRAFIRSLENVAIWLQN